MTFRARISDLRHAGVLGLVCLAGVCILRAGDDEGRLIEIVPPHNATINTNVNGALPESGSDVDKVLRRTTHPFNLLENAQEERPAPYKPPQARPLTQREQEWLERRKDWVFMTPEELMSDSTADEMLGIKDYDKDESDKKSSGTALERYYQHLLDSDHSAATITNKFRDWVSDSPDKDTNSIAGLDQNQNDYSQRPFDASFNLRPGQGFFQPNRADSFADTFSFNTQNTTQSEDAILAQKEQQEHLDAFKQIWNIDQPAASPLASSPAPISPAPVADSFTSVQPLFGAAAPSLNTPTSQQSSSSSQQTMSPQHDRNMLMAHPDFTVPRSQTPF